MPYLTIDEFAAEYSFTKADIRSHISDGLPTEELVGEPPITLLDEEEAVQWLEAHDLLEEPDDPDEDDEEELEDPELDEED